MKYFYWIIWLVIFWAALWAILMTVGNFDIFTSWQAWAVLGLVGLHTLITALFQIN
jgi:hypothetical protein